MYIKTKDQEPPTDLVEHDLPRETEAKDDAHTWTSVVPFWKFLALQILTLLHILLMSIKCKTLDKAWLVSQKKLKFGHQMCEIQKDFIWDNISGKKYTNPIKQTNRREKTK